MILYVINIAVNVSTINYAIPVLYIMCYDTTNETNGNKLCYNVIWWKPTNETNDNDTAEYVYVNLLCISLTISKYKCICLC